MKITVHNLGLMKEAEIDLKPLTIFVGPNNSGKSWLAYTLACILGPTGINYYLEKYLEAYEEGEPGVYPPLEKAISDVLNKGSATIDMVRFARNYAEAYFNNVANSIQRWLPSFMSTNLASFQNLQVSVDLAETKAKIIENINNCIIRSQISIQKPVLTLRKNRGERKLYIYTSTEYSSSEYTSTEEPAEDIQLPPDILKNFLIKNIFQVLQQSLYPHVRILPTERTTFITLPHTKRDASRKNFVPEKEISSESPKGSTRSLFGPVTYFLSMIGESFQISLEELEKREKTAKGNKRIKKYIELADILERQILGGKVQISQQDLALHQSIPQSVLTPSLEVQFQPTGNSSIEVSIASSMVKELSPLALYLRYLAQPNELLVIDEPEMNLHPEAQVKLIELLTMLVNADINLVITTHSPYLIDHLTNLIKASEVENKESISNEFYLKQVDSFLAKEKVSVYLVNQGTVTNAMNADGTIDLNTFGDVSDRISDIYFKL